MEEDQGQIYLFRRISELAVISESIVKSLENKDFRRFDILIQQSRKLRAIVRELKKSVTSFKTDSPEQEKELHLALKEYLDKVHAADVATAQYLEELVQTRSRTELFASPEGCAVFAEILLLQPRQHLRRGRMLVHRDPRNHQETGRCRKREKAVE